ncbi:DUF4145 domain-containing protein [Providencia rettgeri]|uniref:DUF4145 domain-containing protein n=1 Tax=Providencia rettgeri TaxID=587 RepID=UPI002AB53F7B|nr:DUF4145 domain-containing protein [Providencia stuartii]
MSKIIPPNFKGESFTCPHCGAFSHMIWANLMTSTSYQGPFEPAKPLYSQFWQSLCAACSQPNVWMEKNKYMTEIDETYSYGTMIYPTTNTAPLPHTDMPPEVKQDYCEAASIQRNSPRGAAALLRLALQKLCKHLGENGENINADIRALSSKGKVSNEVIRMADVLRITGNCSVHPSEMSSKDIDEVSDGLFGLINYIVKEAISDPAFRSSIYDKMPENLRKKAEEQDEKNRSKK